MRFNGKIKTWDDERGFGFIEPTQGGQDIFVHIKAFKARGARPVVGQAVSFDVELGPQGKKRAAAVEWLRPARAPAVRAAEQAAPWGWAAKLAIPGFVMLYLAVALTWPVRWQVAAVYGGLSAVSLMAYAFDKSAAVAGRWRTSERTLLLLGLAGGWPGGLLAQQWLRHKSSKVSFRQAFWGTVVVNVAGFLLWHTPLLAWVVR